MEEDRDGPDAARMRRWVIALLVTVAVLGAVDLYLDAPGSWFSPHVLSELTLVSVSVGGVLALALGWGRTVASLAGARSFFNSNDYKETMKRVKERLAN